MLKTRLIALTGALFCATITVAAAAPTVTTQQDVVKQRAEVDKAINDCRNAYIAFRYGKDNLSLLHRTLQNYPAEKRGAVVLICATYGEAYEDGRRGIS